MERRVKGRMGEWASWKMRRDFIRTVERESNPLTCNEPPHGILAEERLFGLRTIHATDFNRIHCSRNIESLSSSFFFFFPFFFFFSQYSSRDIKSRAWKGGGKGRFRNKLLRLERNNWTMIRLERERERLFLTREEEISFPQLGYLIFFNKRDNRIRENFRWKRLEFLRIFKTWWSRKKFSKRVKKGGNLLETIFFETIFSIDTKGENKYSLA